MAGTVRKVDDAYKEQKERDVRERIAKRPFGKSPVGCALIGMIVVVVLGLGILCGMSMCSSRAASEREAASAAETAAHAGEVQPPYIKSDANKDDAVTKLKSAGFTNVKSEGNGRLINGVMHHENEVDEISIDGDTSWSSSSWFKPSAKVVVRYWSYGSEGVDDKAGRAVDAAKGVVDSAKEIAEAAMS